MRTCEKCGNILDEVTVGCPACDEKEPEYPWPAPPDFPNHPEPIVAYCNHLFLAGRDLKKRLDAEIANRERQFKVALATLEAEQKWRREKDRLCQPDKPPESAALPPIAPGSKAFKQGEAGDCWFLWPDSPRQSSGAPRSTWLVTCQGEMAPGDLSPAVRRHIAAVAIEEWKMAWERPGRTSYEEIYEAEKKWRAWRDQKGE